MRLDHMRESRNVEDRRGRGGRMAVTGGVGTLIVIVLGLLFGVDPMTLLDSTGQVERVNMPDGRVVSDPAEEEQRRVVSVILASTEDVWGEVFARMGRQYEHPRLVLFRDRVESACGMAGAAVGPFYCPGDRQVYLDLGFFDELGRRFKAPGDFAQAYVVAHEVGHHVQNLLGISDRVHAMRGRVSEAEQNELSVRLELQADFFAGLWAHHANKAERFMEPGDVEEGLRAASAVGDDNLQMQSRGEVIPDAFTHGSSAQRLRWFKKGLETGDFEQGDTFSVSAP